MKLNRKFFKKVQREFKPRRSIQFIRDCYKNEGVLHEDDTITTTVYKRSIDYSQMYSVSRQAEAIIEATQFLDSQQKELPLLVPFILSSTQSVFTTQVHDTLTFDLTKVVIPEDLTSQLYALMQSSNFKGIPE